MYKKPTLRFTAGLAVITGCILLIPLIAMQFSNEVDWNLFDFIFAGTLLFGTGFTYRMVTRKSGKALYRVAVGLALFSGLLLIWINGAVGIIGSENNTINLFYFGVIAVGLVGAFMVRFQPKGMVGTMFAMALVQAAVAVAALLGGMTEVPGSSFFEIAGLNGFFIILFVVSALLFQFVSTERGNSDDLN